MKRSSQVWWSLLPDSTALKQQRLPAYRLQLSASMVLSGFFATGALCLGMGIILLLSAKSTKEIEINYTSICANCAKLRENAINFDKKCSCSIPFYLPETMQGFAISGPSTIRQVLCYILRIKDENPWSWTTENQSHPFTCPGNVYMYYKLYGFHQNLYHYILSRSNSQLMGKNIKDVERCDSFKKTHNGTPICPCGAIANSMFNDTIILLYNINSSIYIKVPMLSSGITWWSDKFIKFQNPNSNDLSSAFAGTAKPPNWPKPIYELDKKDLGNNGFVNEDFIVWMRTAAFPTFKKLHRQLNRVQHFTEGLPAGNYSFDITYNFPVTRFQGQKSVVLSTLTWSGGSSLFLGLAYTVTGAVAWLASFSMTAIHLMLAKRKMFFPNYKVKL